MTEQLCTYDPIDSTDNGIPTQNIYRIYERCGRGGIGLILSGDVGISLTNLESVGDPVIPSSRRTPTSPGRSSTASRPWGAPARPTAR